MATSIDRRIGGSTAWERGRGAGQRAGGRRARACRRVVAGGRLPARRASGLVRQVPRIARGHQQAVVIDQQAVQANATTSLLAQARRLLASCYFVDRTLHNANRLLVVEGPTLHV